MISRSKLAQMLFSIDAVLGVGVIGAAALFGAAYSPDDSWRPFLVVFIPGSLVWLTICYLAFRGLTSPNLFLRFVFWAYVVCNLPLFPVGTALAVISIWLWRELRPQDASTGAG